MVQINKEKAKSLINVLSDLHDKTGQMMNKTGHAPSDNSKAFDELSSFGRPQSLKTAYSQGTILLEVAADQLIAFTRTLSEPVQTIAPWSCARTVLESCSLSIWLLDINISAQTRVKRSLAFRYEGMMQEKKIIRATNSDNDLSEVEKNVKKLIETAKKVGLEEVINKNGKRIGVGQVMPSTTQVITDSLDEEVSYRLLSSITHAHPFALGQLSFKKHSESEDEDILLYEKSMNTVSVAYLCNTVGDAFIKTVRNRFDLFGTQSEKLDEILSTATIKLKFRN